MNRIAGTLGRDVRLQWRYGFYAAGIFVSSIWIVLLSFLSADLVRLALPAFLFLNGTTTTFFFVAGLVLFEKREGVLEALVVTPLRHGEYLLSKVVTLTGLATVEALAIVLLGWGSDLALAPVLAGSLLIGAMYTLFGLLAVFRYDSINEFLLPASLWVTVLQLPLLSLFGFWEPALFWIWPTWGPLLLLEAGFEPLDAVPLAVAWTSSLLWLTGLSWLVGRSFRRFVIRREGVR